jgi:CheY-like chemotaxis protein
VNQTSSGEAPLIAVLEDDSFQRTWFGRLLERASFRVRAWGDPREFLAHLGERPLPDVLLLDIVLMDMDAFQILAELEQDPDWCQVPVVLMTASATMDRINAVQRLALRPEGFLAKPIDIRATLLLLRAICDQQDLPLRLRRLRRQRRSEEISIGLIQRKGDQPSPRGEETARSSARRRVEALRRVQKLRMQEDLARQNGEDTELLAEELREAEAEAEQCRTAAISGGTSGQLTLEADLRIRRGRLAELDEKIARLMNAMSLRASRTPSTDASAEPTPPAGSEEPKREREAA